MFNITTTQVSRIINSLKRKGLVNIKIIYKQNSKEIAKRIITPINTDINTYKQKSSKPINIDVKDIIIKYMIIKNGNTKVKEIIVTLIGIVCMQIRRKSCISKSYT